MNSWLEKRYQRPPALGQAVVMAFQEERKEAFILNNLETILVITLGGRFPEVFYRFPGGMQEEGETLEQTALRELAEETGVRTSDNPDNLVELFRTTKDQHPPHVGTFPVRFYAAYGCDFSTLKDPAYGERGDDHEEPLLVRFGDVMNFGYQWPITTQPAKDASLFPPHRDYLRKTYRLDETC